MSVTDPIVQTWIRKILEVAGVVAFFLDICLSDRTAKVKSKLKSAEKYIENFEKWVKSIPVNKMMLWHLRFIVKKIEAHIWKTHPDWVFFIVGYLATAAMSAYQIYVYQSDPGADSSQTRHALLGPYPYLLYPMPANVFGAFAFVLIRRLLKWGSNKSWIWLYMAVIDLKVALFLMVGFIVLWESFSALIQLIPWGKPLTEHDKSLAFPYVIVGLMSGIMYMTLTVSNVVWMLDIAIYLIEFSLLLWLTIYLAIFLTKALRLALRKTDSMYLTGVVGAVAGLYEAIVSFNLYFHPEKWTQAQRDVALLFLGLSRTIGH